MTTEISPLHPALNPPESEVLNAMLAKRNSYIEQGEVERARGAGAMIWIYWQMLRGYEPNLDESGLGEL
jgi:hypothetical protein